MPISPRLRTASTIMAWLSLFGAAHIAIGAPLAVLSPGYLFVWKGIKLGFIYATAGGLQITAATPFIYRVACMFAVAVPAGLQVWVLVELFRLLRHYAMGHVFEMASLSILNRIASLLFWTVLAIAVAESAVTLILGRAAGQWWLGFSFSTTDFGFLFAAGIFLVIARVMAEAHRLADENAKFV
jgi:hypothetical protein